MIHKFRGIRKDDKHFMFGDLVMVKSDDSENLYPNIVLSYGSHVFDWKEVIAETVGIFTGLHDKNGMDIYEGDIVRVRRPIRTTQTHTGDNIPNGSYTEPMEPGIETAEYEVVFKDGMCCVEEDNGMPTPLFWLIQDHTEESIKEAICLNPNRDIWDDAEEGDLQYLLEENNLKDLKDLKEYVSGIEITGNVHDNKSDDNLGLKCHLCDRVATKYFGYHNTYPSCDFCFGLLNMDLLK